MIKNKRKGLFSLLFTVFFLIALASFTFSEVFKYPGQIKLFEDQSQTLDIKFPLQISTRLIDPSVLELSEKDGGSNNAIHIKPLNIGNTNIQIKLLGLFPIRTLHVDILPKTKVFPGGQSVGVRLNTKGVLIVGLEEIEGFDGKKYNPGRKAGLSIGDSILEIDHTKIKNADHVISIINNHKNAELNLKVQRGEEVLTVNIIPVKSKIDQEYRLGLWVRDKTAGVGTLTFYDPDSLKFGALGHAITDIDTGLLLTVENGEVVKSKVASIQQGKKGKPGEIKGIFYESSKPIGSLEKNTPYGIYGRAYDPVINDLYKNPIEIGYQNQVKLGKAMILTTTEENEIESYEISIEKINRQRTPSTKSMIIRVTDKKLLKKSGGIVQGMSGSPIIQDGKLIGAVTHVFVNDPSKGYGLFIEWMIKEAGIEGYNNKELADNN